MKASFRTFFQRTPKPAVWCALLTALLLCCGGYLLFHHLDYHAITLYDESRHGINAYEMEQSGDMVVSTYLGKTDYFNLKPPLSMWGIIAGFRIFGYNALGLRFYSAAAAFICMVLLSLWVQRRYGWLPCVFATALFVGCDILYLGHMARFGDADGLYLLIFTAAMLCMINSELNIRWLYGSALCFGLGFMAKSWHAAMIPALCLLYLCVTGQLKKLKPGQYAALLLFGLLPILPWAVLRVERDGFAFFAKSFVTDVQERVADTAHSSFLTYLYTLFSYTGSVLSLGLCTACIVVSIVRKRRPAMAEKGLFLWVFLPFFLYSLSGFRVYWYILPIFPGLSIAAALALHRLWAGAKKKPPLRVLCAALCLAAAIQVGMQFVQVNRIVNTNGYQRAIQELLDRDYDSGRHVYIQYDAEQQKWIDSDRLCAMLAGDVHCQNGGQDAFARDEESALLFINRLSVSAEILEYYPVIMEEGDVWVLENY